MSFTGVRRDSQSSDLHSLDAEDGDVLSGEDIFVEDDNGEGEEVCKRTQPVLESGAEAAEEGAGTENGERSPCCCHRCSRGEACQIKFDIIYWQLVVPSFE